MAETIQKYKVIGSIDDQNRLTQEVVPPKSWLAKVAEKAEVFVVGWLTGAITAAMTFWLLS